MRAHTHVRTRTHTHTHTHTLCVHAHTDLLAVRALFLWQRTETELSAGSAGGLTSTLQREESLARRALKDRPLLAVAL